VFGTELSVNKRKPPAQWGGWLKYAWQVSQESTNETLNEDVEVVARVVDEHVWSAANTKVDVSGAHVGGANRCC
jgi:hypothetical protein